MQNSVVLDVIYVTVLRNVVDFFPAGRWIQSFLQFSSIKRFQFTTFTSVLTLAVFKSATGMSCKNSEALVSEF